MRAKRQAKRSKYEEIPVTVTSSRAGYPEHLTRSEVELRRRKRLMQASDRRSRGQACGQTTGTPGHALKRRDERVNFELN